MIGSNERFRLQPLSASALRRELSVRNRRRGRAHPHEVTYGGVPSVVYQECEGGHGNFLDLSYRAILSVPEWAARLRKSYSADKWVPRRWDRVRCELDCANSSDALLMNIFCYPGILAHRPLCALLGVEPGLSPVFGYKPRVPFDHDPAKVSASKKTLTDRTEVDMLLGPLLMEAKLTESSFQTAPMERILRYRELKEVFDVEELPVSGTSVQSYQLIRGVLAASHGSRSFVVLCDARRVDLTEKWFQVMRAVRCCELRSRLAILTWQEVAEVLPERLQWFLAEKYGIFGSFSVLPDTMQAGYASS
jgi:hypothetical protein